MSLTKKQLAAYQRRTLRKIQQTLLKMAEAWDGMDEFNRSELTALADRADGIAAELLADEEYEE
ncbi:hypothetical protein EBQ26_10380 [Allofranklinella schreckenbergeri]|uniref:Uncharacterized protein n=1 Tax=Allofranklinella schreckenbergeri TaxID=1076744 RepID=A0A3M6PZA2_9BURK|nr:hypothetical protein [Allofranklinella schreckenbergeri]RMW96006.1 hypothetical protein EBQ26_10380 [Allofranklinella schreckenbergeri]